MYFWSKDKMPVLYKLKKRYKPQMLCYVNTGRLNYIARCIQCGLETILNLPFKSIFGDTRGISECYISRLTQDLEFIFRVPIRNTMIKNGQD
jgi:hypothetical protein